MRMLKYILFYYIAYLDHKCVISLTTPYYENSQKYVDNVIALMPVKAQLDERT